MPHGALTNLVLALRERLSVDAVDRVLAAAPRASTCPSPSCTFRWSPVPPWSSRARALRDPDELSALLDRHRVTVAQATRRCGRRW
ncbi:hypothetical protein NKH77_02140 [Streptomyces sp. M19]